MLRRVELGETDIASLTVRSGSAVYDLYTGEDGRVWAWEAEGDGEIDERFEVVLEGKYWLWIYDDSGKVYGRRGDAWKIWRAETEGKLVFIIQWI